MITIFEMKLILDGNKKRVFILLQNILSKVINGFSGNELRRKWFEKDNEYVAGWKTIISAIATIMWKLTQNKRDNVKIYTIPK